MNSATDLLQDLCEQGQQQLVITEYAQACRTLAQAEQIAWDARDWDTLARLYMPLQEARRQFRLRCGEGLQQFDLIASAQSIPGIERLAPAQLLIAGSRSAPPVKALRNQIEQKLLYVEILPAVAFEVSDASSPAIVLVPTGDMALPELIRPTRAQLAAALPAGCVLIDPSEIPPKSRGSEAIFGRVLALWERLSAPYLAAADHAATLLEKVERYRRTIEVDYACELAHQKLSDAAHRLARGEV